MARACKEGEEKGKIWSYQVIHNKSYVPINKCNVTLGSCRKAIMHSKEILSYHLGHEKHM